MLCSHTINSPKIIQASHNCNTKISPQLFEPNSSTFCFDKTENYSKIICDSGGKVNGSLLK